MSYLIVKDGIVTNIIVCDDDQTANKFGAIPSYDGATIGSAYAPPPEPEPTPANLREDAYNTLAVIEWEGSMLTVTQAAQLWQYYAAEGDTEKTDAITSMIAEAKRAIREQYPDEEGGA